MLMNIYLGSDSSSIEFTCRDSTFVRQFNIKSCEKQSSNSCRESHLCHHYSLSLYCLFNAILYQYLQWFTLLCYTQTEDPAEIASQSYRSTTLIAYIPKSRGQIFSRQNSS